MSNVRKQRALTQNINLMDIIYSTNELERKYIVIGTTGSIYEVLIKDKPECTCLDFQNHKIRCKHIYYILMQVINTVNIDNETYTPNEVRDMLGIEYPQTTNDNAIFIDQVDDNNELKEIQKFNDICTKIATELAGGAVDLITVPESCEKVTQVQGEPVVQDIVKISIVDNWMDNPVQVKSNYKIVFENTDTNKFKFIDEVNDVITTIGKYIEENYGVGSRANAMKLYEEKASMESIIKDTGFAGVYVNKINESVYELYMKIITKSNNGWIFNNYIETIENSKLGRFIVVDM
jgi:hypothetical protein